MFRAFFTFTFSALSRAQEVAVYRYTDIYNDMIKEKVMDQLTTNHPSQWQ